jgi:hypothetical protein
VPIGCAVGSWWRRGRRPRPARSGPPQEYGPPGHLGLSRERQGVRRNGEGALALSQCLSAPPTTTGGRSPGRIPCSTRRRDREPAVALRVCSLDDQPRHLHRSRRWRAGGVRGRGSWSRTMARGGAWRPGSCAMRRVAALTRAQPRRCRATQSRRRCASGRGASRSGRLRALGVRFIGAPRARPPRAPRRWSPLDALPELDAIVPLSSRAPSTVGERRQPCHWFRATARLVTCPAFQGFVGTARCEGTGDAGPRSAPSTNRQPPATSAIRMNPSA